MPIQQWLLVFDDGTETGGPGAPPATVKHTYAAAGVYPATLIVFPFPPFTTANARYYTSADVTVGAAPSPVLSIVPDARLGRRCRSRCRCGSRRGCQARSRAGR